jgi:hypothetical protein
MILALSHCWILSAALVEDRVNTTLSRVMPFFGSASGWGILLCALGAATILIPWRYYALLPPFEPQWRGLPATATWHGIAVASAYGVAGLILIATFSAVWVPAWKPLLLGLAGALGVTGAALYASQSDEALVTMFNKLMPSGVTVGSIVPDYHAFGPGFSVAIGVGVGLLVLAALQFRAVLFVHSPAVQERSGEPVTATPTT